MCIRDRAEVHGGGPVHAGVAAGQANVGAVIIRVAREDLLDQWREDGRGHVAERQELPVSYTHLTLPTICSV
eukprot:1600520-Alexandrium_andersonii.AAC.1